MKKLSTLLFILLVSVSIYAQSSIIFKQIRNEPTLANLSVISIYQDSFGFMWFGTDNGLHRYDGSHLISYQYKPYSNSGIVDEIISNLAEDNYGNLWIASSTKGICRVNLATLKVERIPSLNDTILSDGEIINDIFVDNNNTLWIAQDKRLVEINFSANSPKSIRFYQTNKWHPNLKSIKINRIAQLSDNVILGTSYGFFKIEDTENTKKFIKLAKVVNQQIFDMVVAEDQVIYSKFNNLNRLEGLRGKMLAQIHDYTFLVRDMVVDNNGCIWGASRNGLQYFDKDFRYDQTEECKVQHCSFGKEGIAKRFIRSVYADRFGTIWAGTDRGLYIYNPRQKIFKNYQVFKEQSNEALQVSTLTTDEFNNLWVGTHLGGLAVFPDFINNTLHPKTCIFNPEYDGADIAHLESDLANNVWISTEGGWDISVVNYKHGVFGRKQHITHGYMRLTDVVVDNLTGDIWLGTGVEGLYKIENFEESDQKIRNYRTYRKSACPIISDIVRSVAFDKQGNLWVGTNKGLCRLHRSDFKSDNPCFEVFVHKEDDSLSISQDYILEMLTTKEGTLWIGTFGGGLNRCVFDANGNPEFYTYTIDDGLPSNTIKSLLEDDNGNIWISTNNGLARLNPETNKINTYDREDGLDEMAFVELSAVKLPNGELVFGHESGFVAFNPNNIVDDTIQGEAIITRLLINNEPVIPTKEFNGRIILNNAIAYTDDIILKYNENKFTLQFANLYLENSSKAIFNYRLQGLNETWSVTENSQVQYNNLSPGRYVFELKAANSDGIWQDEAVQLKIRIRPPIWYSFGAYCLYFLVLGVLLWFFRKYSIIGATRKSDLLMEKFEKEKMEEMTQSKLRFYTNISHEFRTPLTLIAAPLENLIDSEEVTSSEKLTKGLGVIKRNTNTLLRLVNELMDFRKVEQGKMKLHITHFNIVSFLEEFQHSFVLLTENRNIDFSVRVAADTLMVWSDKNKLEKVLFNLVSNALKFVSEGGEISILLSETNPGKEIEIKVSDDGEGIPEDKLPHIFERFFQASQEDERFSQGTGIGLAFTQSLLDLMKGSIDCKSELNVGTEFTIHLPVSKNAYSEEDFKGGDDLISGTKPEDVQNILVSENDQTDEPNNLKLLIVEDNEELRNFMVDSFSDFYKVIGVANGKEGLLTCQEELPDIVVSDVMMPVMDGIELCREIKNNEVTSHIPVILLTAKTSAKSHEKGLSEGADVYLAKPFSLNVLRVQIKNLINSRKHIHNTFKQKVEIVPSEITPTNRDEEFLKRVLVSIEGNMSNSKYTVEQLASDCFISQSTLNNKLHAFTGARAKAFIRSIRLKRAAQLLRSGQLNISEVTYQVGFVDLKYFRNCFKQEFGMAPSEYIKDNSKDNSENQ